MEEWIAKLKGKLNEKPFITPIAIDNDCDYLKSLQERYDKLKTLLEEINTDKSIIEEIERYKKIMTEAINDYFRGRTDLSQAAIDILIKELISDPIAVSDNLKSNMAFLHEGIICKLKNEITNNPSNNLKSSMPYLSAVIDMISESLKKNPTSLPADFKSDVFFISYYVQNPYFFRARCSDEITDFKIKDILHVPFSQRYKVRTERFGLPGIPCLYLGTSSYVCWLESGRPADYRFNISTLTLPDELRIFNLAVNSQKLAYYAENFPSHIKTAFRLLLLSIATSFKVKQKNRDFKSEYIISHLITLSCIKLGLDGIAYFSKQLNNDLRALGIGINIAFFVPYEPDPDSFDLSKVVKVTTPLNFSSFKQLNTDASSSSIINSNESKYIEMNSDLTVKYSDTQFCRLDNYLIKQYCDKFKSDSK